MVEQLSFNRKCSYQRWYWLVLLFLSSSSVSAQLAITSGYSYLLSQEVDHVYQRYNFSKQWQENQLYPLTHGAYVALGWNAQLTKRTQLHIQPNLSYERIATTAVNYGQSYRSVLHAAGFHLDFRFNPRALVKGIYKAGPLGPRLHIYLTPGLQGVMPVLAVDDAMQKTKSGDPYRPLSLAFCMSGGIGWHAGILGRMVITPKVTATWIPQMQLHNYTEQIMGTNIYGVSDRFKDVVFLHGVVQFTFIRKKSNWWDRPRAGDKS